MAIDLDATLVLPLASRYAFPDDGKAVLPTSYGNFLDPGAIPTDSDDGGFLPAVMIDRLNWIFCLNSRPIYTSQVPLIYAGDTLQSPAVYTWSPAVDVEGIGQPIAAVQFNTNPGTRQISWRGVGTAPGGALIQNPLYALYDILSAYAGWTLDDFDLATSFATFRELEELGAGLNWCFWQQDRTIRDWLKELLQAYHTDHWETSDGKLAMVLDRGILGLSVSVLATIDAKTDLEGTEDDVEFESDEANFINTLTVKRRMRWTDNQYTDEPTVDYRPSVGLYGPLRGEVELPGLYFDGHGLIWVRAFFARYGFLPAIVRFTVRGLGYATALPGTYLGLTLPWFGWHQPRLLKVLNQEVDPFGARVSFEAFDCQRFVDDTLTLPMVPVESVRRRIRVPDQSVDITPPGPVSGVTAIGSYRQVVLRGTAPGDLDYAHTEIWAADNVNDRAAAVLVRSGAHVPPGAPWQETFAVADGSFYFVWFITVDWSGNGRNGGSGPTGGNWFPDNPTAGIAAAPVLVNTPGIQPAAVTDVYPTAFSAPGTWFGETIVAATAGGVTMTSGTFILKAEVRLTVPSLHSVALMIKRGTIAGGEVGHAYFVNATNGPVTVWIDCWGGDAAPEYGAVYVVTAQVLSQAPNQVSYTVLNAFISLWHPKR